MLEEIGRVCVIAVQNKLCPQFIHTFKGFEKNEICAYYLTYL